VLLPKDATRAVEGERALNEALREMSEKGARVVTSEEVIRLLE
jgi:hypothetical protein